MGLVVTVFALSSACGSEDDGSGSGGSAGSAALAAPMITSITPMAGGLHVMWTNVQTDCDEIEGERKTATVAYAVVFKVPGDADNKHDGTAIDPVEYTFRVRCRKGADYSPYSNEMSATP
jgi:hypothetical protein